MYWYVTVIAFVVYCIIGIIHQCNIFTIFTHLSTDSTVKILQKEIFILHRNLSQNIQNGGSGKVYALYIYENVDNYG